MSTKLSDQFETSPSSFFSGSYTDDVFIPGTSIFGRRRVYYSAARPTELPRLGASSTDSIISSRLTGYTGSIAAIKGPLTLDRQIYGLVSGRSLSNVVRKFTTETEIFADSVLMAPPDVVIVNGGQLFEGDDYTGDGTGIAGSTLFKSPRQFKIALGSKKNFGSNFYTPTLTSSTDSSQVSDDVWAYSFPFEQKYSSLERFVKPGFAKNYSITVTQSCPSTPITAETNPGTESPLFTGNIYTLQYIQEVPAGASSGPFAASFHNQIVGFQNYGNPTGSDPKSINYGRIEDVLVGFYGFLSVGGNRSIAKIPGSQSSFDTRYNPSKYPGWVSSSLIESKGASHREASIRTRPQVNGWKQGVYHALPQKSHCYFRYNRFGQLRDMFEQRPFTKFHDSKTGKALASPVRAIFVNGTSAQVTASSPVTLNPTVSGIYDTEGKMGRPFNDATGSV